MASNKEKDKKKSGMLSVNATFAENRRARYEYAIEETFEAGIELLGTEVKSLRLAQCSINEAHVGTKGDELYLLNSHIAEYMQAGPKMQHDPKRIRKLLLKRREINKLIGAVNREGYTIIALKGFFNARGIAKILIGVGKGKQAHDKRETMKKRDWGREKQRLMRDKG